MDLDPVLFYNKFYFRGAPLHQWHQIIILQKIRTMMRNLIELHRCYRNSIHSILCISISYGKYKDKDMYRLLLDFLHVYPDFDGWTRNSLLLFSWFSTWRILDSHRHIIIQVLSKCLVLDRKTLCWAFYPQDSLWNKKNKINIKYISF